MTKDQLIEKLSKVKNPRTQRNIIYEVLDELGISYKRTNCSRCLNDLLLIAKEELGLVESAAEESSFNDKQICGYVYKVDRPIFWNGHKMDNNTPKEIIERFVKRFPKCYEAVDCQHEDEPKEEYEGHTIVPHPDIV